MCAQYKLPLFPHSVKVHLQQTSLLYQKTQNGSFALLVRACSCSVCVGHPLALTFLTCVALGWIFYTGLHSSASNDI